MPPEWFAGLNARTFGDEEGARVAFAAARVKIEKIVREQPDYADAWGALGLIDAGLGRKEEAVHEGRHACELLPISTDAYNGPDMVNHLATIYAWTGERDLALQTLALISNTKMGLSVSIHYGELRCDPAWDPLRGDPRFDALVASLAPKP